MLTFVAWYAAVWGVLYLWVMLSIAQDPPKTGLLWPALFWAVALVFWFPFAVAAVLFWIIDRLFRLP